MKKKLELITPGQSSQNNTPGKSINPSSEVSRLNSISRAPGSSRFPYADPHSNIEDDKDILNINRKRPERTASQVMETTSYHRKMAADPVPSPTLPYTSHPLQSD